jgi:HEAT repeats
MGKRGRVLIALTAVAVLAVLAWTLLHAPAPEPVYNGKPLSYWLQGYMMAGYNYGTNRPTAYEAAAAMRGAGTNSIPVLLQMLRAHDSPLKTKLLIWTTRHHIPGIHYTQPITLNVEASLAFYALGPQATNAVPDLIKILDQNISDGSRGSTASVLGKIGPEAAAAVPALLRAAASTNEFVYTSALSALGWIHADSGEVVPVLIKALHDPWAGTRSSAIFALGCFGGDAKSAVPALVALLNDPSLNSNRSPGPTSASFNLRGLVQKTLQQIDPGTYARVVTNAPPASTP